MTSVLIPPTLLTLSSPLLFSLHLPPPSSSPVALPLFLTVHRSQFAWAFVLQTVGNTDVVLSPSQLFLCLRQLPLFSLGLYLLKKFHFGLTGLSSPFEREVQDCRSISGNFLGL